MSSSLIVILSAAKDLTPPNPQTIATKTLTIILPFTAILSAPTVILNEVKDLTPKTQAPSHKLFRHPLKSTTLNLRKTRKDTGRATPISPTVTSEHTAHPTAHCITKRK
jgi:hypothetical protein